MPTQNQPNRSLLTDQPIPGEVLVGSLQAYDVPFLAGEAADAEVLEPAQLMAALITHPEARLRLALIPLLLRHPEFSAYATQVAEALPEPARIAFQCFYTAACVLQAKYLPQLEPILGSQQALLNLFSQALALPEGEDPEERLRALGERQKVLSGRQLNWAGTYEHAARQFVTTLERERRWELR